MQKSVINNSEVKGEKNIPTHVVAVFAFVEKRGEILLAKRSSKDPQAGGEWSTPGGKVEEDVGKNIILQTLKKEIMEEVGIEIKDDIKLVWDEGFIRVSGHHVVGMTFLCRWKSGIAKPLEDQEEIRWFSLKELEDFTQIPNYLKPRVKKLIETMTSPTD